MKRERLLKVGLPAMAAIMLGVAAAITFRLFQNASTRSNSLFYNDDGTPAEFRGALSFTNGLTNCEAVLVFHISKGGLIKCLRLEPAE